jgi:hypothetical protein
MRSVGSYFVSYVVLMIFLELKLQDFGHSIFMTPSLFAKSLNVELHSAFLNYLSNSVKP